MTTRPSILLVEDSNTQALQMRIFLEREGFAVARAATAEAALEMMTEARPDLLLVDFHLPGMNGDELVRQVRLNGSTRALPILMLTGGSTRERELQGLDSGASAYIAKSSDKALLIGQLRALLRQRGAAADMAAPARFQRGALMLITSDPTCRRSFEPLLDAEGYRTLFAGDAAAFPDLATHPIDCVIVDIGTGSEEDLRPLSDVVALRTGARNFEVVALGDDPRGSKLKVLGFASGADDVLLKSEDRETQAARIRAVVRRKLARDEEQRIAEHERQREMALASARAEAANAEALAAANQKLSQLNAELEESNRGVLALHAQLEQQADQLRRAGDSLERQVAERTLELEQANTKLRGEAEARERIEADLRQSQKMEAVGQLTGGLAHDFNNLLAGISGSLELMAMRISQGRTKDIDKYMVAAQGAAKRAAALTHRLLAFSRRQTLAPKATDVNALVGGMLDLIRRTVGPSVAVETVCMAGLWAALVDTSQLENALLNLCINARDAMPNGGGITIETANCWIDRHGALQHDMPEGQYLSLCVSDTGTGMPPEVIVKAFDPFFTTKPIGEGTGLGLSMIYGFAKQSGGQARIYSEMGEGTTVCIYLPRHFGEAEADASGPEKGPAPLAEAGETVLIVDDEPTVRMLVADVLDDLGYTALEAADGAGGLRVLQSNVRVDLLVTDVGLPGGMNGRQVADAARASRPDLKVLFITGFAENALLNNGQLGPGMAVLTKPFAVDTLAARIRELISA